MEWAIELCRKYNKPIAATMAIGPKGDRNGVPPGECAVRYPRATSAFPHCPQDGQGRGGYYWHKLYL